jgi:polyferredoxin
MRTRGNTNYLSLARRTVQIGLLLLFVAIVAVTRSRPDAVPGPWTKLFFLIDPFLLLATWLAAHAVPLVLLWALPTLLLTAVFGRVFCGWVCPLGAIHAITSRLVRRRAAKTGTVPVCLNGPEARTDPAPAKQQRGQSPLSPNRWSSWQLAKYYLLAGGLAMAVFGGHAATIFDPIVMLYRTTTTVLFPATQWAVEEGSTAIFVNQPDHGPFRPGVITEPIYGFLRDHVFTVPKQAFVGSGLVAGLFFVTLALNAYRPRFWCRYLCPLGGLLGLVSWRPLLRRVVDADRCNGCGLCGAACHGAAAASPGHDWMAAECLTCFDCHGSCPRGALKFQWMAPWRSGAGQASIDLSKRATLSAALGGVAALAVVRATPLARGQRYHPDLIRPPGARPEREFLQRCTACGMCMKVCPTGGLQPAWSEAGWEGLWTPRLVPAIGHCDSTCNLCGQVCPTGAIRSLPLEEKQRTKIGLASFDIRRCIPYAYGRDCMVCEEHCPVDTKAIYCVETVTRDHDGHAIVVKQPRVDPKRCIGCGQCENVCVFKDRPAIHVFSANESRNPDNQPILDDAGGGAYGG